MPTIRRFANCKIAIYADDHIPPHYHIEGRGFRLVVDIETMTIKLGDGRKAGAALEWARANHDVLRAKWSLLNRRNRG